MTILQEKIAILEHSGQYTNISEQIVYFSDPHFWRRRPCFVALRYSCPETGTGS